MFIVTADDNEYTTHTHTHTDSVMQTMCGLFYELQEVHEQRVYPMHE